MREEFAGRNRREGRAKIAVQEAERSSRRVVEARKISYAYGDTPIIKELSVKIMRGERIGMIGNNGVGKSTLLRLLLGQLEPNEGSIKFGEHLEIGYFDQLRQQLDPNKTVAEVVGDGRDHVIINGREVHVVGYLRGFLFSAKRAMTPVGFLSGGECNRVILAKLFTRPTNLLILDEPTNDLDVETLELLEDLPADYQRTIIVVSHDRAFLDNVVTSTLVFEENGEVLRYPGGYSDWLRQGKRLAAKDEPLPTRDAPPRREAPAPKAAATAAVVEAPKRAGKLSYKLQVVLDQLPARIEAIESDIAMLENDSAAEDFYSRPFGEIHTVLDALAAKREALDAAMTRWDELETMQREGG